MSAVYSHYPPHTMYDPVTGFSHVPTSFVQRPVDSYEGTVDPRHRHLGSYVKSAQYTQGCIAEDMNNSLASRSHLRKVNKGYLAAQPLSSGLSSADIMFPSAYDSHPTANRSFNQAVYNRYDGGVVTGDPYQIRDDIHPFDSVVIDEPRDLAYLDNLRGDYTFVTRNFNQSRDLRGDIAVKVDAMPPPGASLSTHGPYATLKPYRPYVY